jgi:hypothetical protein
MALNIIFILSLYACLVALIAPADDEDEDEDEEEDSLVKAGLDLLVIAKYIHSIIERNEI